MTGLLRGTAVIVMAVVVGTIVAVNVLLQGLLEVLTRSDVGGW